MKKSLIALPRSGFTIIEISIVLGIIGIITGSLFALYSMVSFQNALNQATDEVSVIANNMRSYYSGQSYAGISATCPPQFNNNATYVNAGVFPPEMIIGNKAYNAWNITSGQPSTALIDVCNSSLSAAPFPTGLNTYLFAVQYTNLTTSQCIQLVMRTPRLAETANLQTVGISINGGAPNYINAMEGTTRNGAPKITTVTPDCSGGTATIDWYYAIGG